jgi:hypothetical protein
MKLLIKVMILIITSPYLMFPYTAVACWYNEHPLIVSQVTRVELFQQDVLLGKPLYANRLDLCTEAWRDFKSYMNYEKITSTSSQQYKFISEFMDTTYEDGLLRLKSDTQFIGVALGSYFGKIGSKFKFTLEGGVVFYAVKVEEKSDSHTINGCVQKWDSSIIEFVVNKNFKNFHKDAANAGNLAVLPQYRGMIEIIEIINIIKG